LDRYTIPKHLDDPELIGFWTLDEFIVMFVPFLAGILTQHVVVGLITSISAWFLFRKIKAGRDMAWILHVAYWHLPGSFFGLRVLPPSHIRVMAG
jgi:conjugal transfer pilus assembly protein TraL